MNYCSHLKQKVYGPSWPWPLGHYEVVHNLVVISLPGYDTTFFLSTLSVISSTLLFLHDQIRNIENHISILVFIFVFIICNLVIIRWKIPRHGICQMFQFYASKIPEKTSKLRHFWQTKNENVGCFTHLFWTNWLFLCNYLLKYKLTPFISWKPLPKFGKFHRILRKLKNTLQMAFVTNSRSKNSSKSARNTTFSSCQNLLFAWLSLNFIL